MAIGRAATSSLARRCDVARDAGFAFPLRGRYAPPAKRQPLDESSALLSPAPSNSVLRAGDPCSPTMLALKMQCRMGDRLLGIEGLFIVLLA